MIKIIIEGEPGSGRSLLADIIKEQLRQIGIQAEHEHGKGMEHNLIIKDTSPITDSYEQ